jgi:hypothetical protein
MTKELIKINEKSCGDVSPCCLHETLMFSFFLFFLLMSRQLARISTNPTNSEVNDHVNLQWLSY